MISSIHTNTVIPFQIVSRDPTPCRKSAHFRGRANFEPVSDPLQISLRFLQFSSTRIPIGRPCSQLSFRGRKDTGLPSSTFNTRWVSVCLSAGGIIDYVERLTNTLSVPLAFWPRPNSIFGLSNITTFNNSSHMLRIPPFLAPIRIDASRVEVISRFSLQAGKPRVSLSIELRTKPLLVMHAEIENCR